MFVAEKDNCQHTNHIRNYCFEHSYVVMLILLLLYILMNVCVYVGVLEGYR